MSKSPPIRLSIRGLEHVVSHKNSKMLTRGRLITDPKKQKWMDRCTLSFEHQLRSEFQMRGIEITTGLSALSLIASLLPLDDSRKWIASHSADTQLVSKGEEGADILIEVI